MLRQKIAELSARISDPNVSDATAMAAFKDLRRLAKSDLPAASRNHIRMLPPVPERAAAALVTEITTTLASQGRAIAVTVSEDGDNRALTLAWSGPDDETQHIDLAVQHAFDAVRPMLRDNAPAQPGVLSNLMHRLLAGDSITA